MTKRFAFTLAELLITLAVIGVVAAMTIPTLTQNYKKKIVEVKLQKFQSLINEAIRLSEVDNGDTATWETLNYFCTFDTDNEADKRPKCKPGTEEALLWHNKYLAPYIKTINTQVAQDKTYCDTVSEEEICGNSSDVILYFHDGSALQYSGRGFNYYINGNKMIPDGRPKRWGIDAFPFLFLPNERIPVQAHPYGDCTLEGNGANCTYLIQQNGWKIPEDYPYKF